MIQRSMTILLALTLCGIGTVPADARLTRDCRREIVRMCGLTRDRDTLRGCLAEKQQNLSPECRADLMQQARDRMAGAGAGATASGATEYRYGTDAAQALDFYRAPVKNAPLVIFVHGGGWTRGDKRGATGAKSAHFAAAGYAFASIDYRMVPATDVAGEAVDVAAAIAWLRKDAARLGIDPNRIVLIGHSAGAHLAALVGTDERYLKDAGVPLAALRGIVLLDGAGYDVPAQIAAAGPMLAQTYRTAFGTDVEAQQRVSPMAFVAPPDAADWLIVHDANRTDSGVQARGLAAALTAAGAAASVLPVPDSNHMKINRNLGTAGDFLTQRVDAYLAARLSR